MGGEAIKAILMTSDLSALQKELEKAMGNTRSKQIRKKLAKRLKLVRAS
jgi:DNA-directed RNA polymerase subunit beta'